MPAAPSSRRRVEFVVVPILAALCMALIIGSIVLDRDSGACPAPTWHNHVKVVLDGSADVVAAAAAVTACTGTNCVPVDPTFAKGAAKASSQAELTTILSPQPDGTWVLTLGSRPPATVTFRVFDATGKVLAQQANSFNWTRIGGSERCGGPMADMQTPIRMP